MVFRRVVQHASTAHVLVSHRQCTGKVNPEQRFEKRRMYCGQRSMGAARPAREH